MEFKELEKLRDRIDRIDEEIVNLLARRFQASKEIARIKKRHNLKIKDERREEDVIKNCKKTSAGRLDNEFLEELMNLILLKSKEVQRDAK